MSATTVSTRPSVREPEGSAPPPDLHELERVADVLARALAAAWLRRHGAQDAEPTVTAVEEPQAA